MLFVIIICNIFLCKHLPSHNWYKCAMCYKWNITQVTTDNYATPLPCSRGQNYFLSPHFCVSQSNLSSSMKSPTTAKQGRNILDVPSLGMFKILKQRWNAAIVSLLSTVSDLGSSWQCALWPTLTTGFSPQASPLRSLSPDNLCWQEPTCAEPGATQ